jgi:GntR family transcriptional regulator
MRLQIDSESKVPIYVQIEEQIRALIAAGQLRPGEQLPTIRELAADLRVNYNTVAHAYLELDRDGVISTQRGRGTFVAGVPDKEQMARKRQRKLHAVVRSALDEAQRLGYEADEIAEVFGEEMAAWREEEAAVGHKATDER